MLQTFLSLPFYLCEADETPVVDNAPALHSTETVEVNSNAAELVDMDTMPTLPPSHTAAPLHIRNDDTKGEEAATRRHACRERDAGQSLALSEPDAPPIESSAAVPVRSEAEMMLDGDSPDNSLGRDAFSSCDKPHPISVADLGDWKQDLRYMDQKRRFRISRIIPEDDPQYEELEDYLFYEINRQGSHS